MLLTINLDDPRSIYEQIADGIRQMIAKGTLAEGSPLPPVRQLAADLGVNMNTIATAYRELQKDGLITVKHGTGSVVSSRTSSSRNQKELLSPLQSALTQLVLAGWPRRRILDAVTQQLETVADGTGGAGDPDETFGEPVTANESKSKRGIR